MKHESIPANKISLISEAIRRKARQRHDYSRVAGKLFAIAELLCTVVRETQELAEDHKEPIMREIGGTNIVGDDGLLRDALCRVSTAAARAMDAANPEDAVRIKPAKKPT